jgi:acyl CoA:acetate/3-ketoacid CoA transferase beta subunit
VFEFKPEGMVLTEISKDTTLEEIKKYTTAKFTVAEDLKKMEDR